MTTIEKRISKYQSLFERLEPMKVYTKKQVLSLISGNETDAYIIFEDVLTMGRLSLAIHSSGNTGYKLVS